SNQWIEVNWKPEKGQLYPTGIEVKNHNRRGMLANVSSAISGVHANIEDLKIEQRAGSMSSLNILVEVEDRKHLATLLRGIRGVEGVVKVARRNQVGFGRRGIPSRGIGAAIKGMVSFGRRSLFKVQSDKGKQDE
ncbi:MAG: ACT domain-containing protein, partial [Mariprofundaceae bacterium]